jgi:hypothetical protein
MINTPKIDYKEILDAWIISLNPTSEQQELAKLRLQVCSGCEYRKEMVRGLKWSVLCTECGCPLNKKVFSTTYNACGLKKWGEIDSNYLKPLETKNKKTLL